MHGLFGGPLSLGALGPGPAGPLDKTALCELRYILCCSMLCLEVAFCQLFIRIYR